MLRTAPAHLLLLVALGSPLSIASAQARGTSSASGSNVRTAIAAVNARYLEMLNKGDVAGFARVYDDDATVMPPNMETVHGQPAIADWWQGGWNMGLRNLKLATTELFLHGDEATEVGTWTLDAPMADGSVSHDHGKFMVLWKRNAKGEWKWHRDIYNSDVALPAPAASGMKKDSTR
jgi:ketosteroid isomerase-like protein